MHFLTNAEIIYDIAIFLIFIAAVDTAYSLYERMLLERLVIIQNRKWRCIKTRDPHIDNNGHMEVGIVILE